MIPSPSSANLSSPSLAAGTKRPAAAGPAGGASATPSKRQATSTPLATKPTPGGPGLSALSLAGSSSSSSRGNAVVATTAPPPPPPPPTSQQTPAAASFVVAEDQLVGRTPEQLVAAIMQIQTQHQSYVAAISAQYEAINQQLNELRGSLAAFFNGQATANQAAASQLLQQPAPTFVSRPVAISGPPSIPHQSPAPSVAPPRPPNSHPHPRPSRPAPTSPQDGLDSRLPIPALPKSATSSTSQTQGPPAFDYRTLGTVEEVWREYKEGMDGQPAVEYLDSTYGSRWRPEPRGRTWYSRRKVIWDKIKEFIDTGLSDADAVAEVEKLRDGGTINKLIRLLQDERKAAGMPDESIGA